MPNIDLTAYVVAKWGNWFLTPDNFRADALRLSSQSDGLTMVGPVRVRVTVQAQNSFTLVGTSQSALQTRDVYSYILDVPPGQTWTYPHPRFIIPIPRPFPLAEASGGVPSFAGSPGIAPTVGTASYPIFGTGLADATITTGGSYHSASPVAPPSGQPGGVQFVGPPPPGQPGGGQFVGPPPPGQPAQPAPSILYLPPTFGSNDGFVVVIRPAGPDICADPCAPDPCAPPDPCVPRPKPCSCGCSGQCTCHGATDGLLCDFAVANQPNLGAFFPAACEPCTPGAPIGMPTPIGPALMVAPARGGTVRTRFFNGMFITYEDLETDKRNLRLKRALMNRALGQGVVWGLNVCQDGDAVCVLPGYGVDCCGNDIVVTMPYRVDGDALLRDPAAAAIVAKRGPQCLSLVLEYYECPEQPRPVHGDPCSPDTTRCEMSRVRETARLRLAPPCEVDDSGPIKDFLAEVTKLSSDPAVGKFFNEPDTTAALAPAAVAAPQVPFSVMVENIPPAGGGNTQLAAALAPPVAPPMTGAGSQGDLAAPDQPKMTIRVTCTANAGFQFAGGTIVQTLRWTGGQSVPVNNPIAPTSSTATTIVWQQDYFPKPTMPVAPGTDPIPVAFEFQLQNWAMTDASGNRFSGTTKVDATPLLRRTWSQTPWGKSQPSPAPATDELILHIEIPPTQVQVQGQTQPNPFPCVGDPCCPDKLRFPVTPPWLHADPEKPSVAADPRVIMLAILYAWLASEMARTKAGTPQQVVTGQLQLATALYRSVWKLFYGTVPDTDRYQLTDALQKLFAAWCRALLYPGPKCLCEPHGVVIGCVRVEAGVIAAIDPWGGRRWVMHYPLLAYWGQQFGIMPLDAIASKFFGMICCIAQLPPPRSPIGQIVPRPAAVAPATGRSSVVNLGPSVLLFEDPAAATARLGALNMQPARVEPLNPFDFIARVSDVLNAPPPAPGADVSFVRYTVLGLPEISFVTPVAPSPRAGLAGAAAPTGRLGDLVATAIVTRPARAAVPPLLRDASQAIVRNVLTSLPTRTIAEPASPVVAALANAGVTTVGGVLGQRPDDLLGLVTPQNAASLADLLDESERTVRTVSKAVGDALTELANEKRITSRDDLRDPAIAAAVGSAAAEKLAAAKLPVAATDVTAAVSDAATGS